jgi:predicted RNA-binding protein YlxR (DUF448 family)
MSSKRRKHVPERTCVVCGTTAAKRNLTRLVRTSEAGIQLDPAGKLAGRGAYLCDNPACWTEAAQGNALARALRAPLPEEMRRIIAEHGNAMALRHTYEP